MREDEGEDLIQEVTQAMRLLARNHVPHRGGAGAHPVGRGRAGVGDGRKLSACRCRLCTLRGNGGTVCRIAHTLVRRRAWHFAAGIHGVGVLRGRPDRGLVAVQVGMRRVDVSCRAAAAACAHCAAMAAWSAELRTRLCDAVPGILPLVFSSTGLSGATVFRFFWTGGADASELHCTPGPTGHPRERAWTCVRARVCGGGQGCSAV